MKVRSGPAARSTAVSNWIEPSDSGLNSASPISTWLGGDIAVPIALRNRPSTMMMRVKPVIISSAAGRNDS
ncbi:hypothetical protein G6F58_013440 [Rhizopus delemar]|nr:hypothetical protein G6F58_013440 [Rhizopus delemar]